MTNTVFEYGIRVYILNHMITVYVFYSVFHFFFIHLDSFIDERYLILDSEDFLLHVKPILSSVDLSILQFTNMNSTRNLFIIGVILFHVIIKQNIYNS